MGEGGLELEVDGGVGLVEVLAALAVADKDVGDADSLEHEGRGFAGVGALVEPVHVLRGDMEVAAAASTTAGSEVGAGQRTTSACWWRRQREEGFDEGDRFGGGLVHLPVGGDEFFAHVGRVSISREGGLGSWKVMAQSDDYG